MPPQKQKKKEDEPAGAPQWMVTFSDCMTLLLTFFVLMLSYANFDESKFKDLADSVGRKEIFQKFNDTLETDAVVSSEMVQQTQPTKDDSETPKHTIKKASNFQDEKKTVDFKNVKVITVDSQNVFYASGHIIRNDNDTKTNLKHLATLLLNKPSRIVISEFGQKDENSDLGMERAYAIYDYLIKLGVNKNTINISAQCLGGNHESKRTLEITLLERSIYE